MAETTAMTITLEIRSQFGRPAIWPVCETARALCTFAGVKTLTPAQVAVLHTIGYAIVVDAFAPEFRALALSLTSPHTQTV